MESLIRQTDGPQWQRHRKVTASAFNERVNQHVWTESILQSTSLGEYWSSKSAINSVAADTRTVSLHVMSRAVFGKSYPFRGADKDNSSIKEDSSSYGEALRTILDFCIPLLVLGRKNLSNPWLPKSFRELYQATLVFQEHMTKAYEGEKRAMMGNDKLENNLMASLVRASQANVDQKGNTTGSHQEGLTEEEVYGNLFVYNFAGHDATANSLAIGVCLLATRPDTQEWIAEEINAVLGDVESKESSYETAFPRLPRCLAVVVSDPPASCIRKQLDSLPPVRDSTSLHSRCNREIHGLQSAAPETRYPHRSYPQEYSGHTQLFRAAHASSLLGPRFPQVRALTMDHREFSQLQDQRLPGLIIASSGALQGAAHSQQSLCRLVRRRAQLPWAQVRAGRIRWRAGGTVSRLQSDAGALGRRGRWDGEGAIVGSDQNGYRNEAASADAASGKGGAEVDEAIARDWIRLSCCKSCEKTKGEKICECQECACINHTLKPLPKSSFLRPVCRIKSRQTNLTLFLGDKKRPTISFDGL